MDGQASRQNQDSRDYRILRIHPARVFDRQALAHIPLGEIPVMGKSASRAKRNPENPANPVNPDSDKAAPPFPYFRAAVPAFYPVIPAKAGIHKSANSLTIRNQAPRPAGGSLLPIIPRHSRESGNPQAGEQHSHPKPSAARSRRIPSPFMGEG